MEIRDTLLAVKDLLGEGEIKAYGLSNESTLGLCQYVAEADKLGMPRPASIQNSFSLVNRTFECELAEACAPRNYNVALLPWSVLGGGALTGKYSSCLKDKDHATNDNDNNEQQVDGNDNNEKKTVKTAVLSGNARFVKYRNFMARYHTQAALEAARKYEQIAHDKVMSVADLAHAFVMSRFYVMSAIVGATSLEQLKENIDACENMTLDVDTLAKIEAVHNENKDIAITFNT